MSRYKVSDEELSEALAKLSGWSLQEGKLHKEYRFASFARAIGWMTSVAILADKMNHHPEWFNVYNKVKVDLVTHDLGNVVSNWDLELAYKMEELAAQ